MTGYISLLNIISKDIQDVEYRRYINNNVDTISNKFKSLSNSIQNIINISINNQLHYIDKIKQISSMLNTNTNQSKYILDLVTLHNLSKTEKNYMQRGGRQVYNMVGGRYHPTAPLSRNDNKISKSKSKPNLLQNMLKTSSSIIGKATKSVAGGLKNTAIGSLKLDVFIEDEIKIVLGNKIKEGIGIEPNDVEFTPEELSKITETIGFISKSDVTLLECTHINDCLANVLSKLESKCGDGTLFNCIQKQYNIKTTVDFINLLTDETYIEFNNGKIINEIKGDIINSKILSSPEYQPPTTLQPENMSLAPGLKIGGVGDIIKHSLPEMGDGMSIDPIELYNEALIVLQNLPNFALKMLWLFPKMVSGFVNNTVTKICNILGIDTNLFVDFKKPLDFIYLLLFATATIPFVGAISNLIIIIKAMYDGRMFLAIIVSLSTITSFFMFHMLDMGFILKVIYSLDVYSYNNYHKQVANEQSIANL